MASVDVVIPCYQYGRYLGDCISSVLNQDIEDLRILIIDNASTDNSVEIAQQFAALDPRIEINARQRNTGATSSWNEGIDWATADYFLVLCADDRLAPGALKRATDIMDQHPDIIFTNGKAISVFSDNKLPIVENSSLAAPWNILSGHDFISRFCRTGMNRISGCTAVVRTAAQKEAGHYRPELPHTDDFEMWMRLAALGPVAETSTIQGISLIHGSNHSAYYHQQQDRDLQAMFEAFEFFFSEAGSDLPMSACLRKMATRSLGQRAYWSGWSHLLRRKPKTAMKLFRFAVGLSPSVAVLPPVSYLFRIESPLGRLGEVFNEIFRRSAQAQ